jgi:hypothetical protein
MDFQQGVKIFSRPFLVPEQPKTRACGHVYSLVGENPALRSGTLGASSAPHQPDWRQQMTDKKTVTSRRGMLKGAAVAAGAMSVPMVAMAQTTTLRFQSTWPAKDIFHEYAQVTSPRRSTTWPAVV